MLICCVDLILDLHFDFKKFALIRDIFVLYARNLNMPSFNVDGIKVMKSDVYVY